MQRFHMFKRMAALVLAGLLLAGPAAALAEEIWLFDNSRIYGLVRGVTADKSVTVLQPTGEKKQVKMEEIIAVRFLGRNPLLVQSGTQEFRFINGGNLRGQVQGNKGDIVQLQTAMAGMVPVDLDRVKGFVALPLAGFSGRKAEELVESGLGTLSSQFLRVALHEQGVSAKAVDVMLDVDGSTYPGVIRKLEQTHIYLDHEELLQVVPVKVLRVAGVRLADATRDKLRPWRGDVQIRLRARDESIVQGHLARIYLGKWHLQPLWDVKAPLQVELEEISLVQVLGGRVQYLSQLTPVSAKEETILAPPQPYRIDRSCQGDPISIAGKRYPWGVGVHANSELTFALNGRFNEFRADIGIATRMGKRGSVVFSVLGDGKQLYKSPVVRGQGYSGGSPIEMRVPVKGIKMLTLKVTDAGDLDLGDVANWGSARVLR